VFTFVLIFLFYLKNKLATMMKKLFYTTAFLILTSPITSFAQNLAGMYERLQDFMGNPTVLILKEDGKFEISTGGTSVRGIYSVSEGKISFTDESGDYADTMAGLGEYTMDMNGDKLLLKSIKDKAIQRKDVLTAYTWRRIKG
jgi:hypothetical protein